MFYDPNENLIFQMPVPTTELEFSGERFTTAVQGEVRHEHLHRYLFALQFCLDKQVLDIACGEGYGSALLSKFAKVVVGIDNSSTALEHAKNNYPTVDFLLGRAESMPLADHSTDVVISFETIEHLTDQAAFLREVKRVLRPNGLLVISSPDRKVYSFEQGIKNPHHLKELDRKEFEKVLGDFFLNTSILAQASMAGSVLVPQTGNLNAMHVQGFRHLSENFIEAAPGIPSAPYLVALASDELLPSIATGSFDDRPFQLGLYQELQQRHIRILQAEAEANGLKDELARSESLISESRSNLSALSCEIVQLKAAIAKYEQEIVDLRVPGSRADEKNQELERQIAERLQDIDLLQVEIAAKQSEIERLAALAAQQGSDLTSVKMDLESRNQENSRLASLIEQERSLSQAANAAALEAQGRLEELTVALSTKVSALASVQVEIGSKQLEIDHLRSAIQSESASILVARSQSEECNHTNNELSARIKALSQSLDRSTQELSAVLSSRSWQLTKVLRIAAGARRRLPRSIKALLYRPSAAWKVLRHRKEIRVLLSSPLFDAPYYLSCNPDVAEAGIDSIVHYVLRGALERRNPSALFDASFYLSTNPDVAQVGANPLVHFLLSGAAEGRDPNPLFDTSYYLEQNSDLVANGINPLEHYLEFGASEGRNPHPLFVTSYYLNCYPDVATAGINPLIHYLSSGAAEGRNPSPLFDPAFYRAQLPEAAEPGLNLLSYYVTSQVDRDCDPHPLFDTSHYLETNPDVSAAGVNPLIHFLAVGAKEVRDPHPLFDSSYYLEKNSDVALAGINPLLHYLTNGAREARNPSPLFDGSYYLNQNPDVASKEFNPLLHYVTFGSAETRNPNPLFDSSYYLSQDPGLAVARDTLLAHYLKSGFKSKRNPHPLFDLGYILKSNPQFTSSGIEPLGYYLECGSIAAFNPHPLFHQAFYLERNRHRLSEGETALAHYCRLGYKEHSEPNPLFDSMYYLEANPEASLAGINPLQHFAAVGFSNGRSPHPLFDTAFYCKNNPDVLLAGANPLAHFLLVGFTEDRDPHRWFDLSFYLQHSPWMRQTGHNPVLHYLDFGATEGKDPHRYFDTAYYLDTYPDVLLSGLNPLVHYVLYGRAIGYNPNPYCTNFLAPPHQIDFSGDPVEFRTPSSSKVQIDDLKIRPTISVLMPTYNSPVRFLELAIQSVQQQTYPHWELCICDDGSSSQATLELLNRVLDDDRIRLIRSPKNEGISKATNHALAISRGTFVAFMDHDDELTTDALSEVVQAINSHPHADVIYSDQDYINEDGSLHSKFYKPDWSPELFRGVMYVGHLLVVRRDMVLEVGGCDSKFDFVQDFELMLRISEHTQQVVHVPRILYHWRRIEGSVALHGDAKPGIESLQAAAVNAHFKRTKFPALASPNPKHAHRLIIRPVPQISSPSITLLLIVGNRMAEVLLSMTSILDQTVYRQIEIAVLDTGLVAGDTLALPFRTVGTDLPSALKHIETDFVVIIRPEIEVLSPQWLDNLLLYAAQPDIAFVGPLILDVDGTVLNAGLIVTGKSTIQMAMEGFPADSDGYAGSLSCSREVTALDPVCVMIETEKLRRLEALVEYGAGSYQLIDLCRRAAMGGMRNICNPRAILKRLPAPHSPREAGFEEFLFQNLWTYKSNQFDSYHNKNFGKTNFGASVLTK